MKLKDTIIFSIAIAFLIIGLHQSMTVGFEYSYWLFMVTIGLLLWYKVRKDRNRGQSKDEKAGQTDKKLKR